MNVFNLRLEENKHFFISETTIWYDTTFYGIVFPYCIITALTMGLPNALVIIYSMCLSLIENPQLSRVFMIRCIGNFKKSC
jgi:hypothetical protein